MTDWKESTEYQRVLEILNDYWIDEPEERQVTVCMTFRHCDGSVQNKRITWTNPAFRKKQGQCKPRTLHKLSEVRAPHCTCT